MSDLHDLTDKDIKRISEAAYTVKKFSKYIKDLNCWNRLLKKNIDESIKAGDVTNEQKVAIHCHESMMRLYDETWKRIRAKCTDGCYCDSDQEKKDSCPIFQEFIVADWMRGAANGNDFDWKFIFEYAVAGRLAQKGRHWGVKRNG